MNALNESVLRSFPAVHQAAIDALLADALAADPHKLVVLDDDPTGTQTVHDVSVFTDWTTESVREGFVEDSRLFFILTNSRGMTEKETAVVHREIAQTVAAVSRECGKPYLFLSRSDSTLRGHYPLETQMLRESMEAAGEHVDGEILAPFFKEGGRFTIGNIHYVRQGDVLIPAAETEFAQDRTFGYEHSALPDYIEEKTLGAYRAANVTCISLDSLRAMDLDGIEAQLMSVKDFGKVCLNAVDYCDLKVFCVALCRALAKGKRFLFRTAAGLVKVLGGVTDRPLLTRRNMIVRETPFGGVVVVGSHTQKTTAQLSELLRLGCTVPVAFNSNAVLDGDNAFYSEVDRCVRAEEKIIRAGKTAVCYTSRTLLTLENDTRESALLRSIRISDGVQSLVGRLTVTPAFVVAKGGITSSDVGVKALRVRRATVVGQICPSVPVWRTGAESRFPQTPFVIFPGNTGSTTTLREVVEILTCTKGN